MFWIGTQSMFIRYVRKMPMSAACPKSSWWLQMSRCQIDLSHKSHNAPAPYPTMHHFETEMCTCVHISVYGASCGICLMHCGISEICLLAPKHRSATTMLTRSWLKYRESFHAKHISCHIQLNKWYWRNVGRSVIRWFLNYQWFRLLTTIPLYAADIDHIGPV